MSIGLNETSPSGHLDRWAGVIATMSSAIGAAMLFGMFVLINVEVAVRYILNSSTLVTDEYAGYMFAALTYLGMNHAIHAEKLITIELTGPWGTLMSRPLMQAVRACLMLGLNLALLYAAWLTLATSMRFHSRSVQYSQTLLAYPQSLMVLGLALGCLASGALILRAFKRQA